MRKLITNNDLATEKVVNNIDLEYRSLWTQVIQTAAEHAKNGQRSGLLFFMGNHFNRLCEYLNLDPHAIRNAVVPIEFQEQEHRRRQLPIVIRQDAPDTTPVKSSYYLQRKRREQLVILGEEDDKMEPKLLLQENSLEGEVARMFHSMPLENWEVMCELLSCEVEQHFYSKAIGVE